jgi:hypothetical protein
MSLAPDSDRKKASACSEKALQCDQRREERPHHRLAMKQAIPFLLLVLISGTSEGWGFVPNGRQRLSVRPWGRRVRPGLPTRDLDRARGVGAVCGGEDGV